MRRAWVFLFVTGVLWPRPGLPQVEPAAKAPQLDTTVQGTVPELTGRWLVVANVSLQGQQPQEQQRTAPIVYRWEVTTRDGKPQLAFRWGGLPPALKASVDAATVKHEHWEPTPEQLAALRDGWDTIPPDQLPLASIETTMSGADALPEKLKADPTVAGSLFVVQSVLTFEPGPQRPARDAYLLSARERIDDGYRGNYASVTLAVAQFPIPIAFAGTFRLYPIEAARQQGFLARLLDMFRGCGRTP
jgi:hypothetical protein